ncbi:hypothetical protein [Scytonema sp. NUACC21]
MLLPFITGGAPLVGHFQESTAHHKSQSLKKVGWALPTINLNLQRKPTINLNLQRKALPTINLNFQTNPK